MAEMQQSRIGDALVIVIDDDNDIPVRPDGQLPVDANQESQHSAMNTEAAPASAMQRVSEQAAPKTEHIPPTIKQDPKPGSHAQQAGALRLKPRDHAFWSQEVSIYNPWLDDGVEGTYMSLWMQYAELRGDISQRYHKYQQSEPQKRGKLIE